MAIDVMGTEAALAHLASTDFDAAHLVRCYNTTAAAIVVTVTDASDVTVGTLSILPNSVEVIKKWPHEKLQAAATGILAVKIAKSH
jgi:hypothetical protein